MNRFNATTAEWVVAPVEPTEILRKLEHRGEIRLVACDRIFHEMGGFADIPIMEDIEFSRRLHRMGALPCSIHRSGHHPRRFRSLGNLRSSALNATFIMLFYLGVSPEQLQGWYYRTRFDRLKGRIGSVREVS